MAWVRRKYLVEDFDRHKNARYYVRLPGQRKIRIREEFDTKAFWDAYDKAVGNAASEKETAQESERPPAPVPFKEGSFGWLCQQYFASVPFKGLDSTTQAKRRGILESCILEPVKQDSPLLYGYVKASAITPAGVEVLRDRKGLALPEAANGRLKALRGLFKWGHRKHPGFVKANPAVGIESVRNSSEGFHTWTVEEIHQFLERHGPGTKARRAFMIFIYSGARKSDAIRFGRQHFYLEADAASKLPMLWLKFTAYKNRNRKPVHLQLPVLPQLAAEFENTPKGQLTLLLTEHGRPYTDKGFGNRMRAWCDQAKLPQCTAHGIRKAAATFAAENGATEQQLKDLFGWLDPKMPAHYTRQARQKLVARHAIHLIDVDYARPKVLALESPMIDQTANESVPPTKVMPDRGTITGKKPRKIKSA